MSTLQTLVVDDSASARVVLKRMLEKNGIQVHQTCSGTEALQFLRENTPDLIFMDHTMPGMDGLETTKAISSDPRTATIPIVMYTAQEGEDYLQRALAHGAIDIMSKPVSWDKVVQILGNLFNIQSTQNLLFTQQINDRIDRFQLDVETLVEEKLADASEKLRHTLQQEIQNLLSEQPKKALPIDMLPLIHSVTDSKLHQLNIELRNHVSAKLDVMGQDLREEQQLNGDNVLQEIRGTLPTLMENVTPIISARRESFFGGLWQQLKNNWLSFTVGGLFMALFFNFITHSN